MQAAFVSKPRLAPSANKSSLRAPLLGARPQGFSASRRITHTHVAEVVAPVSSDASHNGNGNGAVDPTINAVPVATLADTPTKFPIAPENLIALAKRVFATNTGVDEGGEIFLANDFRFEFPVVSLDKEAYLKAVRGFSLKTAIPNLNANAYDFRVDPYEPNRVWFTIRTTGTHTGTLKFGSKEYAATNNQIQGAPECCSYVFHENGKLKTFTGGYVMDRRVGNTGGLGAVFGILTAIGVAVPKPGSFGFAFAVFMNKIFTFFKNLFGSKKNE